MEGFAEILARYGFQPTKLEPSDPYYTDQTVYENAGRRVTVSSVHKDEQWCDVEISGYGAFEPIKTLFAFVRGIGDRTDATRANHESTDPEKQHARCAQMLV